MGLQFVNQRVSVGTTAGMVKSTQALDRIQSACISFGFSVGGGTHMIIQEIWMSTFERVSVGRPG